MNNPAVKPLEPPHPGQVLLCCARPPGPTWLSMRDHTDALRVLGTLGRGQEWEEMPVQSPLILEFWVVR
jgi:hypothetical protein